MNTADKFLSRIRKTRSCWLWTGGRNTGSDGSKTYGQIGVNGKTVYAHRLSWILHNGPIPDGQHVLHRCDVHVCVNPKHLFLGTHKNNMNDCTSKGRRPKGEAHWNSKLTRSEVMSIRSRYKPGNGRRLAAEYGVGPVTISQIVHRTRWGHIK